MGGVSDHNTVTGPSHVAIIMDGNGRWAKARGLPRIFGHRKGAEAVRRTIQAAGDLGLSYLTLFGFSSENWNRSEKEVGELMRLLRFYLQSETADLHAKGVKIRIIGDRTKFSSDTIKLIDFAEEQTKSNESLTLVLALSYGARQEITAAVRAIALEVAEGNIRLDEIDENHVTNRLLTADIPDPDLLIRTSGEQRISNFLLWQLAYTELVFDNCLWPDFGEKNLKAAIQIFNSRERRFGLAVENP
ncbi:MAG: isoprenyl transferase [Alphaproteobacteria bacterium]|nr:isoprenyl transferase [Alphaproteobacteria bacterium]